MYTFTRNFTRADHHGSLVTSFHSVYVGPRLCVHTRDSVDFVSVRRRSLALSYCFSVLQANEVLVSTGYTLSLPGGVRQEPARPTASSVSSVLHVCRPHLQRHAVHEY